MKKKKIEKDLILNKILEFLVVMLFSFVYFYNLFELLFILMNLFVSFIVNLFLVILWGISEFKDEDGFILR